MNHRPQPRTHRHAPARRQAGVSLVESLLVMAITAVTLGAVLPGMGTALERRHLEGAAAQLETDVMFTRSLAVAGNRTLRMSFQHDAGGSCYVVHTGSAGACSCASGSSGATCTDGAAALRSVRFASDAPLQVRANVGSMAFDPTRGTNTPTATLRLLGRDAQAVHLVVNLMGRVRACSPNAAVIGYRAC
ncbi:MAG: GspH/FimT family pseudopilin [Rubrivivax sp.]|nr:GspH/FimT family pseudopilin [Rubrivivax sp.]